MFEGLSIAQMVEVIALLAFSYTAYQAYAGLSFGVFRVRGMSYAIFSVCGALIIILGVLHWAPVLLHWLGFGLPWYGKYLVSAAGVFAVAVLGVWIAFTRAKATPEGIWDAFASPIIALTLVEGSRHAGLIKFGFVEAVRAVTRHLPS